MGLRKSDQAGQLPLFGLELASSQAAPTAVAPDKPPSLRLITSPAANASVIPTAGADKAQQRADLLALNEEMLRSVRLF